VQVVRQRSSASIHLMNSIMAALNCLLWGTYFVVRAIGSQGASIVSLLSSNGDSNGVVRLACAVAVLAAPATLTRVAANRA
jgi:hypothetical protein